MTNRATATLAAAKILRAAGLPVTGSSDALLARASMVLASSLAQSPTAKTERLPMPPRSSGLAALQRRVDAIDTSERPGSPAKRAADLAGGANRILDSARRAGHNYLTDAETKRFDELMELAEFRQRARELAAVPVRLRPTLARRRSYVAKVIR